MIDDKEIWVASMTHPSPTYEEWMLILAGVGRVRYATREEFEAKYPTKHSKPVDTPTALCNKGSSARC